MSNPAARGNGHALAFFVMCTAQQLGVFIQSPALHFCTKASPSHRDDFLCVKHKHICTCVQLLVSCIRAYMPFTVDLGKSVLLA